MIAELGYVAGLLLAGVLAWAGVAKLRRPAATTAAFRGLGLAGARALALAVPVVELATGVLLVVRPWLGGMAAAVVLSCFTGLLAARLRSGAAASCGCFGSTRTEPISSVELVRNGVLLLAAAAAMSAAHPVRPTLGAVVAATGLGACAVLVLALLALRRDAGALWRNTPEPT